MSSPGGQLFPQTALVFIQPSATRAQQRSDKEQPALDVSTDKNPGMIQGCSALCASATDLCCYPLVPSIHQ